MPTDTERDDTQPAQDDAELGTQDGTQTPGDTAAARPAKAGDQPESASDDQVAENDPLVLARKGSLEKAKTAPPATPPKAAAPAADEDDAEEVKTDEETPKEDGTAEPAKEVEPEAEQPKATDTNPLLNATLEAETWGKLSHKDKSTFLAVRTLARKATEEATKSKAEVTKARKSYETVERFVADQGLDAEGYRNSVIIAGMVAKGDPRALPALEESVKRLRQKAGIVETVVAPPAPAVDPDELMKAIEEAEESFDHTKLKALVGKLKTTPAPVKPVATPPAPVQQQQQAAPGVNPDAVVNEAIAEYLVGSGVPDSQVLSHLQGLIKKNPGLANVPVQQRLRAVMQAHSAARPPATPPKRVQQPISGRGRTAGGGSANDRANQDPLVLARQRRTQA